MKERTFGKRARLGLVLLLSMLCLGGCAVLARRAFPKTKGTVSVPGLHASVEVLRDKYGVPHVYARTAEDLLYAQGYVHAQDRFWQMEFGRRAGAGRLSELFGKRLLDTDIYLRTMGFRRVAEQEYEALDAEARHYLDAYVAGINAYIQDRDPAKLGLEFSLLGLQGTDFEIEEWKPADSLTWVKLMAQDLSRNLKLESLAFELIRTAGLGGFSDFFAPYREDMPFIVPDEELGLPPTQGSSSAMMGVETASTVRIPFFWGTDSDLGSNGWVVSGDLTTTGKPILANDTHLAIRMPSIWYEMGLHTTDESGEQTSSADGEFNVRGFSFPGYPGIIIGHNSRIAWGMTNIGGDVQDLYFERINPRKPNQYLVNGEWRDMELIHERIDIKGEDEPYVLVVRKTRHGPIVSDHGALTPLVSYHLAAEEAFPDGLDIVVLSLKWTALMPGELLRCVLLLNKARNFEEFRDALRYFDVPAQNMVYADVDGNIGYQTPGTMPIRKKGDGRVPVPGWIDDYEWLGFVPFEELPFVYNPEKGYIVTANNPVASSAYAHSLGTDFAYGYRSRRIVEMIENDKDGISLEDVQAMQGDTFDQAAMEIVPYLAALDLSAEVVSVYLRPKKPRQQELQALELARQSLLTWDGRMDIESPQAALYGFFWLKLAEETFRDQYPLHLWNKVGQGRLQNALYYLVKDPRNLWWDDVRTPDVRETRDDILIRAFKKGYRAGVERLGKKLEAWRWGDVHQAEFRNESLGESGITIIENLFNRGPVATAGGNTQVTVASWNIERPFKVTRIPAMRQIIDLGDLSASVMIHAPGQSGHPRHRHYDDMIEAWRLIEYHPSLWSRSEVQANLEAKLVLEPQ